MAVFLNTVSDDDRLAQYPAIFSNLDVRGIEPKVRETPWQRPVAPSFNFLVQTSTKLVNRDAFSQSLANLTFAEEEDFKLGNALFRKTWVAAPSSITVNSRI